MSNIFTSPAFLEDNLAQGVKPNTLADFISANVPEFRDKLSLVRQRTGNDPRAIEAFLFFNAYGTTKPAQRVPAMSEPRQSPQEPNKPTGGLREIIDAPGDLATGAILKGVSKLGIPKVSDLAGRSKEAQNIPENANKVVEHLDTYAGTIAAPFGPVASGAATAIGRGATNMVREIQGERDPNLLADIAEPVAEGVVAGAAQAAVSAAPKAIKSIFKTQADEKTQQLVMPKVTSKLIKDTGAKSPELVKKGLLSNSVLPDETEKRLAQTASTIEGFGKSADPLANAQVVRQAIGKESDDLLNAMRSSDPIVPHKEIGSSVRTALKEAGDDFGESQGVFTSMSTIWDKISKKYAGTASGQWQARIDFYQEIESRYGAAIFEKGTARATAAKKVGQAVNEVIDRYAQRTGVSFSDQMGRLSQMYDIMENLATHLDKSSGLMKLLKTPLVRYGAAAAAGTSLGGLGIRSLNNE